MYKLDPMSGAELSQQQELKTTYTLTWPTFDSNVFIIFQIVCSKLQDVYCLLFSVSQELQLLHPQPLHLADSLPLDHVHVPQIHLAVHLINQTMDLFNNHMVLLSFHTQDFMFILLLISSEYLSLASDNVDYILFLIHLFENILGSHLHSHPQYLWLNLLNI